MKLITKHTTLRDFEKEQLWFIHCPISGVVYKIEIVGVNIRSRSFYAWVTQRQASKFNRTVRLISSPDIAAESMSALLHRLQTKQFEIR